MASHARQQYFADWETLKKEAREFAMTDELKQKLDSIEWWAQVNVIEDVKVNWVSLEVVDKSVDVLVPLVIDNLYTVDWDNALSAKQWKILYDYIQNLQSRGRYLSNWNTATWLPSTNPSESPYEYRAGDYYVVSVTAATWGTNYRPDGSSYTIGVASTTVETEPVHITDIYLYDWTNWLLLTNSTREIPIDDALSTTSTNPVENRVVTNAINTKQDKLIAWNNIQIAQDGKTISATDTTYSAWTNVSIDANNVISAVDTTYTAWANINIDANNVISATDTVYAEWTGIDITDNIISNEWVLTVNGNNWNVTVNDVKVSPTAPVNPTEGVVWYDTTNDILKMYDGTNWNPVGENDRAVWWNITGTLSNQTDLQNALDAKQDKFFTKSATAPSNPSEWDQWYDDTNNVMKFYDGTEWKKIDTDTDVNAQWWNITGTLSNQTDLQTALDNKITKEDWNAISTGNMWFWLSSTDYNWNPINASVSPDVIRMDKMAGMGDETIKLSLIDRLDSSKSNPSLIFNHTEVDESLWTTDNRMVEYDTYWVDFMDEIWDWQDYTRTNKSYTFDETSNGIVRFQDLDTDRLKSFYLPSDVTTQESLATAQAAYEYMAVGVPILRMGSMYDTSPWTLTFFPVKKVNPGASWTMIFLSTQLSKATSGGYTMVFQDRVEFTVTNWQVTSITKQFTNSNSTLFRFLETNVNYGWTFTPQYAWSPTNRKYVDRYDTVVSATTPGTDLYEGKLWYDTTNDVLKAYDGTNWNVTGKVYTAWTGINITNDVISCTLNPVTVSQTAPSNPESWDLWFNTTKQTLNLYNWTSWVLVGPEIVPITKAAYDLLSSADKNDWRFYLITDNDWTIYVEWANVQNAPISAGTAAPSSPNEWDIWYDTTNDILKVYDGTNWNWVWQWSWDVVWPSSAIDWHIAVFDWATGKIIKDWWALPEESNTKTFYISSMSDTTNAQAALDWYLADKNPIIVYNGKAYVLMNAVNGQIAFATVIRKSNGTSYSNIEWNRFVIDYSWTTVSNISTDASYSRYLDVVGNYSTPFTPISDWHPATKKYVDDTKPTSWTWAPATTPSYIWQQYVDTTNDMLYVATGTSSSSDWTLVGANTWVEVQVISQSDYDSLTEAEKTADVIYLITGWSGWLTVAWTNVTWKPDLIINPSGWTAWQLLAKTANGYEWTTVGTLSSQTDLQTALDAKQDELNAWEGISIWTVQDYSAMRWPSPEGFHIPTNTEWQAIYDAGVSLWIFDSTDGTKISTYLKMPMAGYRRYNNLAFSQRGSYGEYWASVYNNTNTAYNFLIGSSIISPQGTANRSYGTSIRCLKDSSAVPTNSWTVLYQWTWSAWVFYNPTDWLISISSDWTTWYTLMDKNLWATTVYNYWDTMTEDNCWKVYQWGNNYAFSWDASYDVSQITQSSTQVDVTGYWPWNYYSSSTWITTNPRQSAANDWNNLWWWVTWVTTQDNTITNTGVLSVNWQTWNVTISSWWIQLAPDSPLKPKYLWYWTQAQYDALQQYYTDVENDTVYFTIDS